VWLDLNFSPGFIGSSLNKVPRLLKQLLDVHPPSASCPPADRQQPRNTFGQYPNLTFGGTIMPGSAALLRRPAAQPQRPHPSNQDTANIYSCFQLAEWACRIE
jgi:hypothetical protein